MINTHYLGEGRHEQVKNVLFLLEISPTEKQRRVVAKNSNSNCKKHVSKITNNNKWEICMKLTNMDEDK